MGSLTIRVRRGIEFAVLDSVTTRCWMGEQNIYASKRKVLLAFRVEKVV